MGLDRPFELFTDEGLRTREARIKDVLDLGQKGPAATEALQGELVAIRDELSLRQWGNPGGAQGGEMDGVREPRRPRPGGGAASVALEPDSADDS